MKELKIKKRGGDAKKTDERNPIKFVVLLWGMNSLNLIGTINYATPPKKLRR